MSRGGYPGRVGRSSPDARDEAIKLAESVEGVTDVVDEITVGADQE